MLVQRGLSARERAGDLSTASAQDKVKPDSEEQDHGDDLGEQTSNHDVDTAP